MDSQNLWSLFMETGAPEMYLLYNQAKKMEEGYVSDCPRFGASGYKL